MKINFDDLFSQSMPLSALPASFASSQQSSPISLPLQSVQQSPKPALMRIQDSRRQQPKENVQSILQKLTKLTQKIQEEAVPPRKQPKVDIQQLTNKLYQPTPSNKKNCTKNSHKEPPKPNPPKVSKQLNRTFDESNCPRYIRLYNLDKINSIKSLYRTQSYNEDFDRTHQRKISNTKASQPYLDNYIPFYDRLESEVSKSMEKLKFYQKNPQLSCGQEKQLFKPNIIPDKYKNKVASRYNKASSKQTKNTSQLDQIMNSSINTSLCSLDRSIEIMNKVEQHFFEKMTVIFYNKQGQNVVISEEIIKMLSDVEFKILQNFIIFIEENLISNQQFQTKLRQYYYNLQPHEKLQLRSHESAKKRSTRSNQQPASDRQPHSQHFKKDTKQKKEKKEKVSKYHKKVQNFI